MKIAVAGGTGFVGSYITRALLDADHDVTVLSRDPSKIARDPKLAGARAVRADVTEPSSLFGRLTGLDGAVMAVQFPNYPIEKPRKGLTFDRYDRQGTEHLLQECVKAEVERFLYISGAGVDPSSDKSWYRAKGRAEETIKKSPVRHVILRPSWAYGKEDRALNRFVAIARISPVVPKPGVGPQRIQPVFVRDIATAVARAFDTVEAWGRTLEIGGPEVMTMDEIVKTMLDVMGKRRLVVSVPKPLMKLATAPLVVLPKPPLTPAGVEFATQDGLVDTRELQEVLDVHPVSLREGLSTYLRPDTPSAERDSK